VERGFPVRNGGSGFSQTVTASTRAFAPHSCNGPVTQGQPNRLLYSRREHETKNWR